MIPTASDRSGDSVESNAANMQQTSQPNSPVIDVISSSATMDTAVTPQNPFLTITSSRSESGSATEQASVTRVPSIDSSRVPESPQRSVHNSSAPASPMQQVPPTPEHGTRSPMPVAPQPQPLPISPAFQSFPAESGNRQGMSNISGHVNPMTSPPHFDDDETTEPSSAANTADPASSTQETPIPKENLAGHFSRFLEQTRRRLSSTGRRDVDDDEMIEGALICGYLQKLGRNGKWQTRWFESDGECLSYYKSSKRTKLLATLDLEKVGAIDIDPNDDKEYSFTIQVLGRLYHLRADSRASCKDWVITLNRIKEARMEQGNVRLVNPSYPGPIDLLDHQEHVAPRVVVVANRQRTRAVDESQEWEKLIRIDENGVATHGIEAGLDTNELQRRRSTIETVVLARWTKRRSSIQHLSTKLSKWARSIRRLSCVDGETEGVHLDRHVHPPGHDDKMRHGSTLKNSAHVDGALGTRPVPNVPATNTPLKPMVAHRTISAASEDEARMLA